MSTHALTGSLAVRRAIPEDAELVRALVVELARHQSQADHVTGDVDDWRRMLSRPEVIVLLAEVDGRPVGYVSAVRRLHLWSARDVVGLDDLYVRKGFRNRGIGLQLLQELSRHAPELTITWGVQPGNHDAIRFYERLGAAVRHHVVCSWTPAASTRRS